MYQHLQIVTHNKTEKNIKMKSDIWNRNKAFKRYLLHSLNKNKIEGLCVFVIMVILDICKFIVTFSVTTCSFCKIKSSVFIAQKRG